MTKKKQIIFLSCGILLSIIICSLAIIHILLSKRYGSISRLTLREPCLMMVYYNHDDNHLTTNEEVSLLPLNEIQTNFELTTGSNKRIRLPIFHAMTVVYEDGKQEQLIAYSAVKTDDNTFRINIADNAVKFTMNDVKYNGETYLSITHGENWYMAFTRRY
jgi:hypothetical protein